jgi:hypothetical protein
MEPDFHGFPPVELYHLPSDPLEKVNLAESEPEVVAFLIDRMERWVARRCAETGGTDPILQYHMGLNRKIGSITQARDLQARAKAAAEAGDDEVIDDDATFGKIAVPEGHAPASDIIEPLRPRGSGRHRVRRGGS